jgi:hypothetical protein
MKKFIENLFSNIVINHAFNLSIKFLFIPANTSRDKQKKESKFQNQMQKLFEKNTLKISIVDGQAYWVYNNAIYKASIDNYGRIDAENAQQIDVFSLSDKEASGLLEILDSIKED